ncbi:hypothetical protein VPIG_00069 [Vibrio phage PWH3a-P1]|uniref:hypothetical protein n=1 Tax=Vibrio phage PWH3a-P1 TaxID=754058 RepID=UPI0002C053D9|nr:hypothetical protein VPIG_00069 [Vibrio phage PWH3a-P1]AGH31927.1 hypothetical protein VPIG_00069 [Vibrio phage PWH3a-P1]
MTTVYVHKIIESDFNSLQDLQDLFYQHAYNGIVLGVKSGDKLATVQQKKPYNGVCGWSITYGIDLKRAIHAESKATNPSKFETSLLCSANYTVETL